MSPLQTFESIFRIIEIFFGFFGMDVYNPNYVPGLREEFFQLLMLVAIPSIFYTAFAYDLQLALKSFTWLGVIIQGNVKYRVFIWLRKTICTQYAYLKEVHLALQETSSNRYEILVKWNQIYNVVSKSILTVIALTPITLLVFQILLYLIGQVEPLLPIMIPGLDETTRSGWILLEILHIVWILCGLCGFIGSDMTFIMMSIYLWPLSYLFVDHFDELNEILRKSPKFADSRELRLGLRNIVRLHQEICGYTKNVKSFYSIIGFVDCNTNGLTMAFCAFVIIVLNWLPLYALFILFLVKLFAICGLGTLVEIASDRVLDAIQYCEWHLMPLDSQRIIQMMILKAQHTPKLVAGTVPMDFNLFVNIMKNIYSLIMIMAEVDIQI